jgi:arylsulfatase A-like enzyme
MPKTSATLSIASENFSKALSGEGGGMRRTDIFVVAVWAATIFGLLEGIIQCISRYYPVISAAHKVSPAVLWVAPTLDLFLFVLAAAGVTILCRLTRRWFDPPSLLATYGFFVFLGAFSVILAPGLIHPLAALVLSLGLAKFFCHKLRGHESQLTGFLRRQIVLSPALLIAVGLGVTTYETIRESWLYRQLPTPAAGQANVLLIVMDTVRYDSFARPAEQSLTPHLDQIVAKGMRFENAWATSSWSLASQASILTGRYPHEHRADWPDFELDPKYPTLAQFFERQGYVTGAFSGNSAWVTPEYLGQGFLRFDVYILEDLLRRTVYGQILGRGIAKVGYHESGRGKKAPILNEQFLSFIREYRDRPFFAYLCYMDVNQYFHDRWFNSRFLGEASMAEVAQAYEEGLKVLDRQIADIFDELARMGILENTFVVITSDHGQSFGATESNDHDPHGHGTSLYPEQVQVPLFLVFPAEVPAETVTRAVSTQAIAATIVHHLKLSGSPFVGTPLVSLRQSETSWKHGDASALATLRYEDRNMRSLIANRWQYIEDLTNSRKNEELYDLAEDPLARKNVASTHPFLRSFRGLMLRKLDMGSDMPLLLSGDISFKAQSK